MEVRAFENTNGYQGSMKEEVFSRVANARGLQ